MSLGLPIGSGQPGGQPPAGQVPYVTLGGEPVVRGIVERFYDHMDTDADMAPIRKLHATDLTRTRTVLFEFLTGWLGGPQLYTQKYGHPRLRARHMPFPIGEPERDLWLTCMGRALDDNEVSGAIRSFLDERFAHVADFMRNR